ncbi:hypothetical protein PROFUN_15639 [Planoprotostelium fungivorum]|uniref:Uncharacterized protein n=1 Tax=Planoprotostelium fungivorum TaxID=1890364 RepID=A0A2P6MTK3_9EUKA|nr:hypothetical protein PROFUN_15639 [Planoprotostelium fungivorum]
MALVMWVSRIDDRILLCQCQAKILQDHIFTSGYYFQVKRLATSCRSTSIVLNTLRTAAFTCDEYVHSVCLYCNWEGDDFRYDEHQDKFHGMNIMIQRKNGECQGARRVCACIELTQIGGPWIDPSVYNPNCGLKPDVDKHSDTRLFPQRFEGKEEETFRYERDTSLVRDIIDFWKRVASTVTCDKRIPHLVGDSTITGGGKNKVHKRGSSERNDLKAGQRRINDSTSL